MLGRNGVHKCYLVHMVLNCFQCLLMTLNSVNVFLNACNTSIFTLLTVSTWWSKAKTGWFLLSIETNHTQLCSQSWRNHQILASGMNDRKKHRLFELRYTNVDYGVYLATLFELRPRYSPREECVSTHHSGMHHQTLLLVCNTSFPQQIAWLPTIYSCGAYPLAFKEITYVSRNHM